MARNSKKPRGTQPQRPDAIVGADTESAGPEEVLARVRHHLAAGWPEKALEAIRQAKFRSDQLTNATGVCLLRLGNAEAAVRAFRGLVFAGSIHLRDDVPPVYMLNFAAALLAAGNTGGFLTALHDVGEGHQAAERYRDAYRRWLAGHSRWQRFRMAIVGEPPRPFAADFPMGEV